MVSFDDYGSGKFVPAGKRNPRGSASFSNRGSVDQYCNWNIKVVKRVKEHDKGMETFMHDPASQKSGPFLIIFSFNNFSFQNV